MNSWSPPLWFDRLSALAWRLIVIAAAVSSAVVAALAGALNEIEPTR